MAEFGLLEHIVRLFPGESAADLTLLTDADSHAVLQSALADAAASVGGSPPELLLVDAFVRQQKDPPAHILVASFSNENDLLQYVLDRCDLPDSTQVLRLWADLFTNKFASYYTNGTPTQSQFLQRVAADANDSARPRVAYAIACTPRTGSTLLIDLLMSLGVFGFPREHLRDGVLSLSEFSQFNFSRWMEEVMAHQQTANGVFGTKLIGNFFLRAEQLLKQQKLVARSPDDMAWKILRLRRRDTIAQAVSTFLAQKTGVFFEHSDNQKLTRRQQLEQMRYDFEAIDYHHRNIQRQEQSMDRIFLSSQLPQLDIEYEALLENPSRELLRIHEFLELDAPAGFSAPEPAVSRLDDTVSAAICQRYRSDHVRTTAARANPSQQAPEQPGPYQAKDWDIVDYGYFRLPTLRYQWRGPELHNLEENTYFCALGAAQTMGRFCQHPYPEMVAMRTGLPALNLGYSGAGPGFYLQQPEIFQYINQARFVVVQVMSGRSAGNSMWQCHTGRNIVKWLPTGEECSSEQAFRYLFDGWDKDQVQRVVEETREDWLTNMRELLSRIEKPTILLWMSERGLEYEEQYNDRLYDTLGSFPHLINRKMMNSLIPNADYYVESQCDMGIPHFLTSRFTGNAAKVQFPNGEWRDEDRSYPSPEMHHHAATLLTRVIQDNSLD